MPDVTTDNFASILPEFEEHINNAAIIAIDCEFSGLSCRESNFSLLDSASERYLKLKGDVENIVPLQVGVTLFHRTRDANEYVGNMYTFAVFPRHAFATKKQIAAQAGGLMFLCKHKFDFNKCICKAIPYINREQEIKIKKNLDSYEQFICLEWETLLKKLEKTLPIWVQNAEIGDTMIIQELPCNGRTNYNFYFVFMRKLKKLFPSLLWIYEGEYYITIKKVSQRDYDEHETLEHFFIHPWLGFTKVFRLIVNAKKPIVGHNMLMDLLIMYKEFERSLPSSCSLFKEEILNLFPTIYDTKQMSYKSNREVLKYKRWESNALNGLYLYFKEQQGRDLVDNAPVITLAEGSQRDTQIFHNAGWDSYCTGYCFFQMAHISAFYTPRVDRSITVFSTAEHLKAVEWQKNIINLRLAFVPYMKLDGLDPASRRPPLLFVEAVTGRLNMYKLEYMFGNCGYAEIKACSEKTAIVACGNQRSIDKFKKKYSGDTDIRVTKYNRWKQANALNFIIFYALSTTSTFLLGWIIYKAAFSTTKLYKY